MKKVEDGVLFTIEGREDKAGNMYFKMYAKGKGNTGIIKTLTYEQMMEALSKNYQKEPVSIPIGKLPEGYLDAVATEGGIKKVRIYVPAQKRVFLLRVSGQKMPMVFKIPMPPMVFNIEENSNGHFHGDCCIVEGCYEEVKKAYYDGELKGYLYPFGNVSDRGSICMGNIHISMDSLCDASIYVDAFFDGITNHDYVDESRVSTGKGQMELLKDLNGKDEFPLTWLKEDHFDFLMPYEN